MFKGSIPSMPKASAVLARVRSLGPPIASIATIRDWPRPLSQRSFARRAGFGSSHDRHRIFACVCSVGIIRSNARPCSDMRQQSCRLLLSLAAARLKADGAGKHCVSSAQHGRSARFQCHKERDRLRRRDADGRNLAERILGIASASGDGQVMVSAASGPASARWRAPPTTKWACASNVRAAGERAAQPSSRCRSATTIFRKGARSWRREQMFGILERCGFSCLAGTFQARTSSRTFLRDKAAFRPCCRS